MPRLPELRQHQRLQLSDDGARRSRAPTIAAIVVVALSALLHLWELGLRPLAHDEAIDAWFSWQARTFGVMRYDPVYHGPLRFYVEGPLLGLLGTGAAVARLPAALAGIATTAMIAWSRRTLGDIGAPAAALVFTISPTALTVTRTGREDSLVALVSVALLLLVARLLVAPRPRHVVGAAVLLAASFGLKETTFLFGASALAFFLGAGAVAALRPDGVARAAVRRLVGLGRDVWVWALVAFALTFMVIFTSGFRYVEGLESGMLDGVRYWWGQHDVGRGGQPWFFYLAVWGAYEWLLLAAAVLGVVVIVRRRSLVGGWFTAMALLQAALYTWAGEKFAWLALHPLLPAVLLAGIGVEAVARRPWPRPGRVALAVGGGVAALLTAVVAVGPAVFRGADPRELLVAVQTSDDVPPVVDRLRDAVDDGSIDTILVDDNGGGSWPWVWYLHGVDGVGYGTIDPAALPDGYDAYLVVAFGEAPDPPPGYTVERFRARVWWVPDYGAAGAGDLARWFFTRNVWSPTATLDEYLVVREGALDPTRTSGG